MIVVRMGVTRTSELAWPSPARVLVKTRSTLQVVSLVPQHVGGLGCACHRIVELCCCVATARLPFDRNSDSDEPPPSSDLSGRLVLGVASPLRHRRSSQSREHQRFCRCTVGTWCCVVAGTATILSMYWIYVGFTVFCTAELQAPVVGSNGARPSSHAPAAPALEVSQQSSGCSALVSVSQGAPHWSISISPLGSSGWWHLLELHLRHLDGLLDFLGGRHLAPCRERNARRCRLHKLERAPLCRLTKRESEASPLFSVGLGLPELVCMSIVTVLNPAQQRHRPSC